MELLERRKFRDLEILIIARIGKGNILAKQGSSTIGTIGSAVSVTIVADLRQDTCYQPKAGHYQKRRSDDILFHSRFYFIDREEPRALKEMLGFVVPGHRLA